MVPPKGSKVLASNRRARHDYEVLSTQEAGIALLGTEVKSLRAGRVQLADTYARPQGGELWLLGVHIAPWETADGFGGHDPLRPRKLLLHRGEIDHLTQEVKERSLTLVPMSLYLNEGKVKVELALARGRKRYDKRAVIAERDANREAARALSRRSKIGR